MKVLVRMQLQGLVRNGVLSGVVLLGIWVDWLRSSTRLRFGFLVCGLLVSPGAIPLCLYTRPSNILSDFWGYVGAVGACGERLPTTRTPP